MLIAISGENLGEMVYRERPIFIQVFPMRNLIKTVYEPSGSSYELAMNHRLALAAIILDCSLISLFALFIT